MVRIIDICSGKGGVGKTTVAANLSMALQDMGKRVAIVDCNLTTSHLSLLFGAYSMPVTLNDFLQGKAGFSETVYHQPGGLRLVPASLRLGDLVDVDTSDLRWNIREAFKDCDFVILDSAPGIGRETLIALRLCDEVLFVSDPFIPSLIDVRKTKQLIDSMEGIDGYRPFCLGVLLNRVRGRTYEASVEEARDFTGLPVVGIIPEDEKVMACTNNNCLVTKARPRSPASKAIVGIAARLSGRQAIQPEPGLFHRIRIFLNWTKDETF